MDEALGLLAGRGAPPYGLRWHEDYPMTETLDALALVVGAHQAEGWAGARIPRWWLHQIVVGDLVVGDASFHGPPQPVTGEVEIGYNVVEGLRGRGIASCACQLLLAQAWADGASTVRADVNATNPHAAASRRVLLRAGFAPQGQGGFVAAVPGVRR